MDRDVSLVITIKENQIQGLLQNASHGSRYWCGDAQILSYPQYINKIMRGGHVRLRDDENGKECYELNMGVIKDGLRNMLLGTPTIFSEILSEKSDKITGDVFLQCCLLGQVIYGKKDIQTL